MLDKYFDFKTKEQEIYTAQEQAGCFKAGAGVRTKSETFSIMIPPPNVTGSLHMGHALNNTLQDILIRYKRMQGYDVLWQVGSDHAGIATQSLVERRLEASGKKRTDMSREEFIKQVWDWKEQSGGTIMNQLRRLGASCDFSRERFTMDTGLSDAVRKVFVTLHKQGLIYRDKRLVNWDCKLQTAISDLEVIPTETKGNLWHFRYEIAQKECADDSIVIATTRPETMFGDMAVAVNPNDERYKKFIGKHVILPVTGRLIPVIADDYADMETGTGAVKITPAHDFNDFEVGKRHNLDVMNILTPDGRLNENVPADYQGLDRFEARKKLVSYLQAHDILVEIKPHPHKVPYGDRSNTIIEPYLTDQWYVDAHTLAQPALDIVRTGKTEFVPKNWDKTYYGWLDNIQPWCISRQLWWGHQIPAWYSEDGHIFVEETEAEAMESAAKYYGKSVTLRRDDDVLDTWFSSALWAFSTLGWPEKTDEFAKYYPTSVLITGFDIIFFWVARMIMMSSHFTGETPFKDVYIHALVRDEKGQKMSKSKGNVIDPLTLIDEYGADALRFTLCAMAAQGRDIKLSTSRVEGYRNFGTKLWNASRFAQMNGCVYHSDFDISTIQNPVSHWIVSRLKSTTDCVNQALAEYRFNDMAHILYHFIWGDVCDRFIEMAKPFFIGDDEAVKSEIQNVTAFILYQSYILLHPIMPFITETLAVEISDESLPPLVHTAWTDTSYIKVNQEDVKNIDLVMNVIDEIRSLRAVLNVPASAKIDIYVREYDTALQNALVDNQDILVKMARLNDVIFDKNCHTTGTAGITMGGLVILLSLGDLIDIQKEKSRLTKDLEKTQQDINSTQARLNNENFMSKADSTVIDEMRERLVEKQVLYDKNCDILKHL
jgi:valyl-tRNA synthetase